MPIPETESNVCSIPETEVEEWLIDLEDTEPEPTLLPTLKLLHLLRVLTSWMNSLILTIGPGQHPNSFVPTSSTQPLVSTFLARTLPPFMPFIYFLNFFFFWAKVLAILPCTADIFVYTDRGRPLGRVCKCQGYVLCFLIFMLLLIVSSDLLCV